MAIERRKSRGRNRCRDCHRRSATERFWQLISDGAERSWIGGQHGREAERAKYIDNYASEVGLLHSPSSQCHTVAAYRGPLFQDFFVAGLHGYSHEWYRRSIVPPGASSLGVSGKRMGFFWLFERGTIPGASVPGEKTFFLQSLDPSASTLAVTELDNEAAQPVSRNRVSAYVGLQTYQTVVYPNYHVYRGLSAVGNAVEGVYLDVIQ